MDNILDFNKEYHSTNFKWINSNLFKLLSYYYGLCDVVIETSNGMIIVKKYNVVGYIEGDDFIRVYESNGERDKVKQVIYFDSINNITVIF